jgi:hypothetical protein
MDLRVVIFDESGQNLLDLQLYRMGSDSEGAEEIRHFLDRRFSIERDNFDREPPK